MAWLNSVAQLLRGASSGSYASSRTNADADAWSLPYASRNHPGRAPYESTAGLESTTSIALPGAASSIGFDLSVPLPDNLQGRDLRNSNVARAFARILAFCDTQYQELRDTINYPATPADLAELNNALGFELPPAVYEWFLCCNGQEPESKSSCNDGLFFGLPFLSTDRVIEEWQTWRRVDVDPRAGANAELRARMASCPANWVKTEYSCSGWVPLISDHMGNYIGVDMTPPEGGGGLPGQVIVFGRDFDTKVVLFGCDGIDGWSKFLMVLAADLEAGVTWSADEEHDSGNDNSDGEDSIGYESYFYGGTAGTSRGGGDGGGEGLVGFRLAGEYRNWPPLEAWADRARRQWETAGLVASVPVAPVVTPAISSSSVMSSPRNESMDMPMQGSPLLRSPSIRGTPTLPSNFSAEKQRAISLSAEPIGDPFVRGSKNRRARSPLIPRQQAPAPAPIADLPTIEEIRALQVSENAASAAAHQTPSPLLGVRSSIASLARGGQQPLSYRNMLAQRSGVFDDALELSHRSSSDHSVIQADISSDTPPTFADTAVLGSRGTRFREVDGDAPAHSTVQMTDTRVLIDEQPAA
ncbi:Cell wall assembly regulator [Malassezia cuniculi]|uniref:Cell wall assembly regulator n=1 Tax=Malassezia cuniculi TaxID=948313 RepID=A0AAF0J6W2_9BASI|nr:Cell wall assembly regulator [Malassezia cuniculi]